MRTDHESMNKVLAHGLTSQNRRKNEKLFLMQSLVIYHHYYNSHCERNKSNLHFHQQDNEIHPQTKKKKWEWENKDHVFQTWNFPE